MTPRASAILAAAALAASCAASCAATAAQAQVAVTFVAPERYTDANGRSGSGPSLGVTLGELRRIFSELGSRILQPGQSLSIDVLDIDLAGLDQVAFNPPYGLRVVSDATPPRFRLRYALKERDRVLLSGEDTVTDLAFLTRDARLSGGEAFSYERELIRDWLRSRFASPRPTLH